MTAVSLGSLNLDDDAAGGNAFIGENSSRKEAVLTPLPFYSFDSDSTDVFDFGGAIKVISLSGVYIGATVAAVKTFIDALEAFIQGHQDKVSGYPLTLSDPDTRGTIKVKVMDAETKKDAGAPLICRWSVKLVQSSENA